MAALPKEDAENRREPVWPNDPFPGDVDDFTSKYKNPAEVIAELVFEAIDDEDTRIWKKCQEIDGQILMFQTSSALQSDLKGKVDIELTFISRLTAKKEWLLSYREFLRKRWYELYHK